MCPSPLDTHHQLLPHISITALPSTSTGVVTPETLHGLRKRHFQSENSLRFLLMSQLTSPSSSSDGSIPQSACAAPTANRTHASLGANQNLGYISAHHLQQPMNAHQKHHNQLFHQKQDIAKLSLDDMPSWLGTVGLLNGSDKVSSGMSNPRPSYLQGKSNAAVSHLLLQQASRASTSSDSGMLTVPPIIRTTPPMLTPRRGGRFRPNWLELFDWLQYDSVIGVMFCTFCRKWCNEIPDIRTSFVEGNSNFRLEILNHHARCKAHQMCREREAEAGRGLGAINPGAARSTLGFTTIAALTTENSSTTAAPISMCDASEWQEQHPLRGNQ